MTNHGEFTARVFVDAPDPDAYRARLMAALQTAYQNAANLAEIMTSFRVRIIDARLTAAQKTLTRRIVARNESGELCTRGYSVMLGYWNDDTATTAAIDRSRWIWT